jgi:indole-3-glycerol phosphate synthase
MSSGHQNILDQIINIKREAVRARRGKRLLGDLRSRIADAPPTRGFAAALSADGGARPRLIAEVKQASPSKGVLRQPFDPVSIAQIYEEHGAAAISVLTEEQFFLGHPDHLRAIRAKVGLPLLQKDFTLDEIQIYEARALGADACLLIAALLAPPQMRDYVHLARELSLDVLVEVHNERELDAVIEWTPILGINNRDLTTFQTDLATTFRLLARIPPDLRKARIVVSESGIGTRAQMEQLAEAGVDAALIGETFMTTPQIGKKVRELMEMKHL